MANLPKITECFQAGDVLVYKQDGKHMPSVNWLEFLAWGDRMRFQLRQWDTFGQLLRGTFVGMYLRDKAKMESHYMEIHQKQLDASEYERNQHYGFHSSEY